MASLLAATGPHAGARFEIGQELAIGRSSACEVRLPDDTKVSRRHARLFAHAGRFFLVDLGSRNGTVLNGEKLEGEAALQSGDRVQVGDTLFVFDPPLRASVEDSPEELLKAGAVEQFLPSTGESGALFRAGMALLACPSESAALRRGAEETLKILEADAVAALLPGELGLVTAAVVGAPEVKVPRPLLRAADRREAARTSRAAIAPVWAGGASFGALFVERHSEPMDDRELGLLGALGRLVGEAVAAARSRVPPPSEGVLVGTSRVFRRALDQVRRVAATNHAVVLIGESGTGKALTAHYLHARSPRALGPFVKVDCRAPAPVLEEELFGRQPGPGVPPRPAAFVRADGGTLALLAVESLPHELAVKVAREIKERRAPVPGTGDSPVDVRLLVTAREPVAQLAATGRIDLDLAHAIEGVELALPPLRERRTDVAQLFDHFAAHAARVQLGKPPQLSPEAKDLLLSYAWPGNVRELKLCAEHLSLSRGGDEVMSAHLPREVAGAAGPAQGLEKLADAVARLERDAIAQALRKAGGKKIRAAALLGISRPTLDKKIATYKLPVR
ncbi:MAG TPA: sigma 54-interacting transcriptional regulator [Myxococcales bacterium]